MMQTNEGAIQHEHTLDHFVEYFFKAGSLFDSSKKHSFYGNEESALSLFQKIWIIDKELSFKLLLWLRDCRGGAGNRSAFRTCLNWIANNAPEWVTANISSIPEVGRWDDLTVLFGTPVHNTASNLWAEALKNNNVLAAKWCKREYVSVRKSLGLNNEAQFRKFLSKLRSGHIVESKMSTKSYDQISYPTVPSVAMSRYTNAFKKHDEERFTSFKEKVKSGEVKINTQVLFPHDCVRTAIHGDSETANLQFDNLPNYFENTNERVIVLCDTSGSMSVSVSGSVQAVHISMGLALYCSDKIEKTNPFYRKFIGFESESKFNNWNGMSFSEALHNHEIFDGACGATRIDNALNLILKTGTFFNLTKEQMPTALIVVSDMQFSVGNIGADNKDRHKYYDYYNNKSSQNVTPIKECLDKWVEHGYNVPKVIYWNTAGYAGAPDTSDAKNVALVSGFSPTILSAIFNGKDLSPRSVLEYSLEKYQVNIPK